MRDRPTGVTEAMLAAALRDGWGIDAHEIAYLPVGAGGYHWRADDRWFLTVTAAEPAPLERALRTAQALRRDAGLGFVLAAHGAPLRPVGPRHTLSVFPLVEGVAGDFGPHCGDRAEVVDLLVALHRATPRVRDLAPPDDLRLRGRETLAAALPDPSWTAGPYGEPARALLAAHAAKIGHWLSELDRLTAELAPAPRVVTHGEPHPANILTTATGKLLIDWDTVRLAPPERDLWHLTDDPFAEAGPADDPALTRYAEATGHRISAAALSFYRLTWILADIACFAADLRAPHTEGGDAEEALAELHGYLDD
ncbi:aminoglycoside phosphotransferase family protein [Actinoplanes sp. KI2]|uniref:aminoglycoside phosphotransferase family protein n=1 Tax=Actinoplanes sp. KI2 TaxID=2983315 RepID=UPI0021D5E414|nr:aminoglycoside phosphotransferase family protein [Actinoplanes sp. KI2]MCU7722428.1 aminoglycoside phosphotransferase family protein [Actinoplanes sp. KI2]